MIKSPFHKLLLACLLAHLCLATAACDQEILFADDLAMARQAYLERNIPLAERLLERYLREEQDPEKRWEAWNMLLKAINSSSQEARASLECLEAMLVEYENDEDKLAQILTQMGKYNMAIRHYSRAADSWSAYIDLAEIDIEKRVEGYRNLAAAQMVQRHFEAGMETLQQCMALPVPDHDKIYCMLDLADANMTLERWQEVADLCQQILDSQPDSKVYGVAGYLRGDALEQLGQKTAALRQFELARDSYPNPEVMDNRIEHLRKNSDRKKETK